MSDARGQVAYQIGGAIRARRRAAGLDQTELAERIGADRSTVSRWEAGSRAISAVDLVRIAEALGCQPADLVPELA